MRVKAKALGYYDNKRKREGEEFTLRSEKDFSEIWMEKCDKPKKGGHAVRSAAPKAEEKPARSESVSDQEVI